MITACPECSLPVSDKANTCPHCGFPINQTPASYHRKKKTDRRRRLPNGFGQISKIKTEKLRKPYRVMVCTGKKSNGKYSFSSLKPDAYFETYNEAYEALAEYNRNPYDVQPSITLFELYEKWLPEYSKTLKRDSSIRTVKSAWSYCSSVYGMRVCDIRARHIKGCMENGFRVDNKGTTIYASSGVKERIKSMFNLMLDYAVEFELATRNYARTFDVSDDVINDIENSKRGHLLFTLDEMSKFWESLNSLSYINVVLFQCYTGFRPQELGLIKLKNVDLKEWIITGGMKSKAGTDRIVPIHPKIKVNIL